MRMEGLRAPALVALTSLLIPRATLADIVVTDLGTLGGVRLNSAASAVSANGYVVGISETDSGPQHGFVLVPGASGTGEDIAVYSTPNPRGPSPSASISGGAWCRNLASAARH